MPSSSWLEAPRGWAEQPRTALPATGHGSPSWPGPSSDLDETAEDLLALGSPDAVGLRTDLLDQESVERAVAQVGERWGHCNALVNAAGPFPGGIKGIRGVHRCRVAGGGERDHAEFGPDHPCRPAAPPEGRLGPHRQRLGHVHETAVGVAGRLHRRQERPHQSDQEPLDVPGRRTGSSSTRSAPGPSCPSRSRARCGCCPMSTKRISTTSCATSPGTSDIPSI